jgi:hypothetical protein
MATPYCATLQAIPSRLQGYVFIPSVTCDNCDKIVSVLLHELVTVPLFRIAYSFHTRLRTCAYPFTVSAMGQAYHYEASPSLVIPILSSVAYGTSGMLYMAGGVHVSMKGLASRPWLPCDSRLYSSRESLAFVIKSHAAFALAIRHGWRWALWAAFPVPYTCRA